MLFHNLPLRVLREIAASLGIPVAGTKAALIDRLLLHPQCAPLTDTMEVETQSAADSDNSFSSAVQQGQTGTQRQQRGPSQWAPFTLERLLRFMQTVGLETDISWSKEQVCATLDRFPNLQPGDLFQTQPDSATTTQARNPLKLRQQGDTEPLDTFLDRSRAFFELARVAARDQVGFIINAAQPPVAQYATELFTAGTHLFNDLEQALLLRFGLSHYQYLEQFRQAKFQTGQTAQQIGQQLRRLYQRYLGFDEQDMSQYAKAITPALTEQLLNILPATVATLLRTEILRCPTASWDQILTFTDQVLAANRPSIKTGTAARSNLASPRKHCALHGWGAHSDPECRQQALGPNRPAKNLRCSLHGVDTHSDEQCRAQRSRGASSNTLGAQPSAPALCYRCGQPGHFANTCSTQSGTGNAPLGQ